ncbi:sulfotransferase [Thermodesulfobacteriota bacterium]
MKRQLIDFTIIGAQKAGTTSLFKYLNDHPQVWMPPEKEAPFFSDDEVYNQGWEQYFTDYFSGAPNSRLLGKATPHYMCDKKVPSRISKILPNIKLIAILRHPIERAFSHYKMWIRWGREKRTFNEAVMQQLALNELKNARVFRAEIANDNKCYIVRGEYGRIMKEYFRFFKRGQLLTIFTDELKNDPILVMKKIYRFIVVDQEYVPSTIGKVYHVGGFKSRLPFIHKVKKNKAAVLIWETFPIQFRRYFAYWFKQWNTISDIGVYDKYISDENRTKLQDLYQNDIVLLERLIDQSVPWTDLRG